MTVKYVHDILRSVCNINQTKQALQRHTICLTMIMIISLKKLNVDKNGVRKKYKG